MTAAKQSTFEALVRAAASRSTRRASRSQPETDISADLNIDSVSVMDFVMEVEDHFDIDIPLNVLSETRTHGRSRQGGRSAHWKGRGDMNDLLEKHRPIAERHARMLALGVNAVGLTNRPDPLADTRHHQWARDHPRRHQQLHGHHLRADCIAAGQEALAEFGTGTTGSRIANGTYAMHRAARAGARAASSAASTASCSPPATRPISACWPGSPAPRTRSISMPIRTPRSMTAARCRAPSSCASGTMTRAISTSGWRAGGRGRRPAGGARRHLFDAGRPGAAGRFRRGEEASTASSFSSTRRIPSACWAATAAGSPTRRGSRTRSISSSAHSRRASAPSAASAPAIIRCSRRSAMPRGPICSPPRRRRRRSPPRSAAVRKLAAEPERRERIWRAIQRGCSTGSGRSGLRLGCDEVSPVIAVKCADEPSTIAMWNALLEAGVYVNIAIAARHARPAVPAALLGFGGAHDSMISTGSSRCSARWWRERPQRLARAPAKSITQRTRAFSEKFRQQQSMRRRESGWRRCQSRERRSCGRSGARSSRRDSRRRR